MSEFGGDPLAIATVLIRPDTSKFRAELDAELKAATGKPIVIPVVAASGLAGAAATQSAITTGLRESTVATRTFTAATVASATAMQTAGVAAQEESVSLKKSAAAARTAAVAHEQAARGIGATLLSLLGIRGATLAASGPFLAGAAAVTILTKSVKSASAEIEAAARVSAILGEELGKGSEEWARTLANSFGLSAEAALKFEGAIAQVFKNVGVAQTQNAQLSQQLVERAADVAARNNVSVEQVLRAFQLALSGNLRGLRQFVPGITAAEIAQLALADSGKKTVASLNRQELTLARVKVLLRDSANQAGAFANRQGDLAGQTKTAQSNLSNLADSLGKEVTPSLTLATTGLNLFFTGLNKVNAEIKKTTGSSFLGNLVEITLATGGIGTPAFLAAEGIKALVAAMNPTPLAGFAAAEHSLKSAVSELTINSVTARNNFTLLAISTGKVQAALQGLVKAGLEPLIAALGRAGQAASNFGAEVNASLQFVGQALNQFKTLDQQVTRLQISGGSLSEQLAAATAARQKADQALSEADAALAKHPRSPALQRQRDQALQNAASAQAREQGIQSQIDANNAKAAADAKAASDKRKQDAQAQLDADDQAILSAQQHTDNLVALAKAKAAATKPLGDDLAAAQFEVRSTKQEIIAAEKIHDNQLRLETLDRLNLQLVQARADVAAARANIAKEARDKRVAAADAVVQKASLDAQIAEALGHPKDQIAALRRENVALEAERRLWVGNTVKQKEITLEIARNNAQIRDLKKESDKRNNSANELAFSILQEQQGFAANLLSNLLPTSAVAGTVGATTSAAVSTPTLPTPPRPPAPTGPGHAASAAAQVSQGAGGFTAGQGATLIQLMRHLVLIVGGKKAPPRHPEATYQTYTSSTEMAHPL